MRSSPIFPIVLLSVSLLVFCGWRQKPTGAQFEQPIGDASTSGVTFDLKPSAPSFNWLCSYSSRGALAKFRLQLQAPSCSKPESAKDFAICNGKGKFVAEPGSDATGLLHDLQAVLQAKAFPPRTVRVKELPFEYVRFGEDMSRTAQGGFVAKPAGGWTATKIFLGKRGEDEVFLNLNPQLGKGEFSIKDADDGDMVLAELAKVL